MVATRPMTPADIRRQVVVEGLDLSRDGRFAVVARRSIRANRYVTHLYEIRLDRGRIARPRRLTNGLVRDGKARISPDGSRLALVRSDPTKDDEPASILLMDLRTGRERALGHRGYGGVGEVEWSPDGRRLAFTAEVDPPRFLVGRVPRVDARRRARKTDEGRRNASGPRDPPSGLALG